MEQTVERQCEELRGWREQYNKLKEKTEKQEKTLEVAAKTCDKQARERIELHEKLDNVMRDYVSKESHESLKQSYKKLETEYAEKKCEQLREISDLRDKVAFYESRTWLERLFNIKPEEQ